MIDVLCVGHACYDLTVFVPAFPIENAKQEISLMLESGGGPAANAASLLSQWGISASFAGLIGDDDDGRKVIDEFRRTRTDLSLLEVRPGYPTPFSVVIVNEQNGSRTIINRKKSESYMDRPKRVPSAINPKVILFDGHEPDASLWALEQFPLATTILDAGSLREGTRLLTDRVDYLVCSERFTLAVTGLSSLDTADNQEACLSALRKTCAGQIVVTMGDQGLIYDDHGRTGRIPAYAVRTVDTTAAGDIFHGAFAYGLFKKLPLEKVLKLSSAAAALSVQTAGGRQSIPPLMSVQEMMTREALG